MNLCTKKFTYFWGEDPDILVSEGPMAPKKIIERLIFTRFYLRERERMNESTRAGGGRSRFPAKQGAPCGADPREPKGDAWLDD